MSGAENGEEVTKDAVSEFRKEIVDYIHRNSELVNGVKDRLDEQDKNTERIMTTLEEHNLLFKRIFENLDEISGRKLDQTEEVGGANLVEIVPNVQMTEEELENEKDPYVFSDKKLAKKARAECNYSRISHYDTLINPYARNQRELRMYADCSISHYEAGDYHDIPSAFIEDF